MAKKVKVNRSEEVRKYLTENPKATGKEVVEALKKLKVTESLVYNVKGRLKSKGRKTKKKAVKKASVTSDHFSNVQAAARFIKSCGGVENARNAFNAVEKIAVILK